MSVACSFDVPDGCVQRAQMPEIATLCTSIAKPVSCSSVRASSLSVDAGISVMAPHDSHTR